MLYILYGKDEYARHQFIEELKGQLGDREALLSNTARLEGRQLTANQLREVCDTLPFLGEKRLVMVEGLLARFEPGARPVPKGKGSEADAASRESDEAQALAA